MQNVTPPLLMPSCATSRYVIDLAALAVNGPKWHVFCFLLSEQRSEQPTTMNESDPGRTEFNFSQVVTAMKLRKLVKEFDELVDSIERRQQRYDKQLKVYRRKLKENEKVLLKQLKNADGKADRKKLKRELHAIGKTYSLMGA